MDDELLRYKERLEQRLSEKPIWEKECLTIEEAAEYTGIGRTKLRALVNQKKCPFVMPLGNQLFVVREKLEKYLKDKTKI